MTSPPEKFPRMYHVAWSPGATRDDKVALNYFDYLKNTELIFTEKLDGENTCLRHNGMVFAKSHGKLAGDGANHLRGYMGKNKGKPWGWLYENKLDIFGENMYYEHSIEYEHLKEWFYVFAIRQWDSRYSYHWVSWNEVENISHHLGFPTPEWRIIDTGDSERVFIHEAKGFLKHLASNEREGFVVRPTRAIGSDEWKQLVYKWVRPDHVTTDEHWSKNKRVMSLCMPKSRI